MTNNCLWHKNKTWCKRGGLCPYDCDCEAALCADYIYDDYTKTSAMDKLAAWADVSAKAHAILETGGVEIVEDNAQEVRAYVMSGQVADRFPVTDGGPYEVILSKKSWGNKGNVGGWLQGWLCSCKFGYYNSGEPGPRMRGRFCSHSYSALLAANMRARQDFMGDRKANKTAVGPGSNGLWYGDGWNEHNFFMGTYAIFDACEKPSGAPDYTSHSGSEYWYADDGVYRYADHWGDNVSSCEWYISGEDRQDSWSDDGGWRCGFCGFDYFQFVTIPAEIKIRLNDGDIEDVNVTPDMLHDGVVEFCGCEAPYDIWDGAVMYEDDLVDFEKSGKAASMDKLSWDLLRDYGWDDYPHDKWKMHAYLNGAFAVIIYPHTEQNASDKYLLKFQEVDHGPTQDFYGDSLEELMEKADGMAEALGDGKAAYMSAKEAAVDNWEKASVGGGYVKTYTSVFGNDAVAYGDVNPHGNWMLNDIDFNVIASGQAENVSTACAECDAAFLDYLDKRFGKKAGLEEWTQSPLTGGYVKEYNFMGAVAYGEVYQDGGVGVWKWELRDEFDNIIDSGDAHSVEMARSTCDIAQMTYATDRGMFAKKSSVPSDFKWYGWEVFNGGEYIQQNIGNMTTNFAPLTLIVSPEDGEYNGQVWNNVGNYALFSDYFATEEEAKKAVEEEAEDIINGGFTFLGSKVAANWYAQTFGNDTIFTDENTQIEVWVGESGYPDAGRYDWAVFDGNTTIGSGIENTFEEAEEEGIAAAEYYIEEMPLGYTQNGEPFSTPFEERMLTSSNKTATRQFTYAEMQELDEEIEGRELHNRSRLKAFEEEGLW